MNACTHVHSNQIVVEVVASAVRASVVVVLNGNRATAAIATFAILFDVYRLERLGIQDTDVPGSRGYGHFGTDAFGGMSVDEFRHAGSTVGCVFSS